MRPTSSGRFCAPSGTSRRPASDMYFHVLRVRSQRSRGFSRRRTTFVMGSESGRRRRSMAARGQAGSSGISRPRPAHLPARN